MQYSTDGLEAVQKLSWCDLCKQGLLVLQIEDPRFVNRVEDQRACLELLLGVKLVVVNARFSCDIFFPNDGRLVVVRDGRVVYGKSCGATES